MMNWLRERLAGRFGREDGTRLVASLILATLLWGWISLVTDPEVTITYRNVEVATDPLDGNLRLVTALEPIVVELTGPRSVMEDVTTDEVTASIDTSDIDEPNKYTRPIHVETPDGVRKREPNPRQITIEVEETLTDNFTVQPNVAELPDDDARTVGTPRLEEVSQVTVTGSRSVFERVEQVVLPIEIGTHNADFTAEFEPIAQDLNGNPVPEVEITPSRISVLVPVRERGQSIAVVSRVQGEPANGYDEVDRTVIPQTVRVDAPAGALDSSIPLFTEPVDISGRTDTVTRRVGLDLSSLPEGVRVIEPADGMVEVIVQIAQRGVNQTLTGQPIQIMDLAPGLEATIEPETVGVTVVATQDQLERLAAGDITVTVDAAGLGPGTHELAPNVSVPANMRWVRTEPERVTVTISARTEPSGTPQASPESTPIGWTGTARSVAQVARRRRARAGIASE